MKIFTIDLNFLGFKDEIAVYLLRYFGGAVLVDLGPETTLLALIASLKAHDLTPQDVTAVLITHIHLDHAGAAGWFARQGAQVYTHPVGAPHLLNPEKLLASASRLYGDRMDKLWGEMKPTPAERLKEVQDETEIIIGELRIQAMYTPGHAEHHISYTCNDVIFSGDVGGIRYKPETYLRLPFVPPETNLEKWRSSLERMKRTNCSNIAPTHFGIFTDAETHLDLALRSLDETETWLQKNMPDILDVETLKVRYAGFLREQDLASGMDESIIKRYEGGSPIDFAASGLFRYWQKFKNGT